jgi:CRP/FNR family transcriptional regulator
VIARLLAATVRPRPKRKDGFQDGTAPDFAQSLLNQLNSRGLQLTATVTTRTFRRGQHLYRPGDAPDYVYSIYRGTLKTYRVLHDCSERVSGFHFAGELLGLDVLIDRPVRCGAVALETTMVSLIPAHTLAECLNRSEPMRLELLGRFGDEITRLEEHLLLDRLSAEQRLAAFVLWVVDKFSAHSEQPAMYLPMSHKDIGNYLGLVPETVSRLLARFQDREWLSVHRHELIVRNLERLREAACGTSNGTAAGAALQRSGRCADSEVRSAR